MKRLQKGFLLVVGLIVAVIVLGAWMLSESRPRLYEGKTVKEWLVLLHPREAQKERRFDAPEVLARIGKDAMADVTEILGARANAPISRPKALRQKLEGYAVRLHLMLPRTNIPFDISLTCEAACILAEHANVDISPLTPDLRYHFACGQAMVNSSHALALAGPAGIAVLTNYLFIGIDAERDHASWALHYVPDKPGVAAMLIAAADSDTNSTVRANALRSLEKSGAPAELIVPLGQKHFRGVGWEEQWAAICMLRPYCNRPDVRSLFEEAMKYNDDRLRRTAQRALAK